MTSLSAVEGIAILGTVGVISILVYGYLSQQQRSPGNTVLPGTHRIPHSTLFDRSSDDAWEPTNIPVKPEEGLYYTDEERVLRLLIASHGRMKQSDIVHETEWSSAKVSRLLHRMENRSDISRVADGRTKMVYLGRYGDTGEETKRASEKYQR